jgi:hypothetical protein
VGSAYPVGSEGDRIAFRFQDGVTLGEIRRVFIKYVTDHPELENQTASNVLVSAARPVVEFMLPDKTQSPRPRVSGSLYEWCAPSVIQCAPFCAPSQSRTIAHDSETEGVRIARIVAVVQHYA